MRYLPWVILIIILYLKHKVFVISDEIHADFTYEGHKHIVFSTVKKEFEDKDYKGLKINYS